MEHGNKLNPTHSLRIPPEIKGTRQKVIVTHSPNQLLTLKFPDFGSNNVIVPGMTNFFLNRVVLKD